MKKTYDQSMCAPFVVMLSLLLMGCGKESFRRDGTAGAGGASGGEAGSASGAGGEDSGTTRAGGGGTGGIGGASGGGTSGGTTATSSTIPAITAITATLTEPLIRVVSAESVDLSVALARVGAAEGDIVVEALGLPAGVGTSKVTVIGTGSTAQIRIQAGPTAQIGGPFLFYVVATSATNARVSVSVPAFLYVTQPPGSLDVSFGRSGSATLVDVLPPQDGANEPQEYPRAVAVDGTGRILVGGYSFASSNQGWVLRLTPEGALDASFGQGGVVSGFGMPDSRVTGLAVDQEQLFVGAELTNASAATIGYLRRLNEKGLAEPAFNGGLDVTLPASPSAVSWFDDSVLLTAGGVPYAFQADGKEDPTFLSVTTLVIESFVAGPNNRLLHGRTVSNRSFELGRLLTNGAIDTGFGKNGFASVSCPEATPFAFDRSITVLHPSIEGSVLALINCGPGPMVGSERFQSELVALTTEGAPLTSFGQAGRAIAIPAGRGVAAVTQFDGKIVVLGRHVQITSTTTDIKTKLSRFESTGVSDATFGTSGMAELPHVEDHVMAYDPQSRRVVVVGSNPSANGGGITISRVWL